MFKKIEILEIEEGIKTKTKRGEQGFGSTDKVRPEEIARHTLHLLRKKAKIDRGIRIAHLVPQETIQEAEQCEEGDFILAYTPGNSLVDIIQTNPDTITLDIGSLYINKASTSSQKFAQDYTT